MSERIKSFYKKLTHFGLASVLAFSSLAVAGPIFLSEKAEAWGALSDDITVIANDTTIEAGTGQTTIDVSVSAEEAWGEYDDLGWFAKNYIVSPLLEDILGDVPADSTAWAVREGTTITATSANGQVSLDGSSWSNSATVEIAVGSDIASQFYFKSDIVGLNTVVFDASIPLSSNSTVNTILGYLGISQTNALTGLANITVEDTTAPEIISANINGNTAGIAARTTNCGPTDFNLVSGEINLGATITDNVGVDGATYRIVRVSESGCIMSNPNTTYGGGVNGYKSSTYSMTNISGDQWSSISIFDTNSLPEDGNYTIAITARDAMNNQITRYVDITADNTKPTHTIDSHSDNEIVSGIFSLEGTAEDNIAGIEEVTVQVNRLDEFGDFSSVEIARTNADFEESTGVWDFEVDTSSFADGTYRFNVNSVDKVGNERMAPNIDLVVDNTAPVITLIGGNVTLTEGDTYTEQGATWEDAVDGTGRVTDISGNVDTNTIGTYIVTYSYTDSAGNVATETRTVTVEPQEEGDLTPQETGSTLPITQLGQPDGGQGILGDQDDQASNNDENTTDEDENGAQEEDSDVAGAIDEDEDGNMTLFGLAWYWWLLVLAGLIGAWYLLGAWRNRNEE